MLNTYNEQNRLIIIEGPQGTGKTTLANYLRENIPASDLYRLTGQKDKTMKGKDLISKRYYVLLDYLQKMQDVPLDMIFDRTFFTEEVYTRLGYKEYTFSDVYEYLLEELSKLSYDIYYFSLYLRNIELFEKRLKREHHNYQSFSLKSSLVQQKAYNEIRKELEKNDKFNVYSLAMDDFDNSYSLVKKVLKIK